jgi:hypothetical protein
MKMGADQKNKFTPLTDRVVFLIRVMPHIWFQCQDGG